MTMAQESGPAGALPAPAWVLAADMSSMPKGWYWASFPGTWEWYSPERNETRGIDHGDTLWHPLISSRYWGPWTSPPG
jgi:hypothetical protein